MKGAFRKKIYAACGYNTLFMGSGRPEFDPKNLRTFDAYLKEVAEGVFSQKEGVVPNEGVISSFIPERFINQGHLAAFLPMIQPLLTNKPCVAVEGACCSGGRAIGVGIRSLLSGLSEVTFVVGFEIQNSVKAVYGADYLAAAGYYQKERKDFYAHFFPGIFDQRAAAYQKDVGEEKMRLAFAHWYANAIENARKNPKAQEYHNQRENLLDLSLRKPNPDQFLPTLTPLDCSKVSDGASGILLLTEEGLERSGISREEAIEIVSIGEAEGSIDEPPADRAYFDHMEAAVEQCFGRISASRGEVAFVDLHDCFTISGLLALEAAGFVKKGGAADFVIEGQTQMDGSLPVNPSGGLVGFGHPTGATGVRMLVDLHQQLTGKAENPVQSSKELALMINMGGNDKTLTALLAKRG